MSTATTATTSAPITTAAIINAVNGTPQQALQLKKKLEKTKKNLLENTDMCIGIIKEVYSHATMFLQSTISPENRNSGIELSGLIENFLNSIETTCGSIQTNLTSLKKIKQKMVQINKTYVEQTIYLEALPTPEESAAVSTKKPRAKKVKEVQSIEDTASSSEPVVAEKVKKPRAKKVKEVQPTEESCAVPAPVATSSEPVVAEKVKKPRAKKVQSTEDVASVVVDASSSEPVVAEKTKMPRAKKTKTTDVSTPLSLDKHVTDITITEEPTEPKYTVIYPEESAVEQISTPKSKKQSKPRQNKKKNNETETDTPSTSVANEADSMTPLIEPSAPIKENPTREFIPEDDFVPKHLTFDDEINEDDFSRDLEMITDELEEDIISEITEVVA